MDLIHKELYNENSKHNMTADVSHFGGNQKRKKVYHNKSGRRAICLYLVFEFIIILQNKLCVKIIFLIKIHNIVIMF